MGEDTLPCQVATCGPYEMGAAVVVLAVGAEGAVLLSLKGLLWFQDCQLLV